MKAVYKTEITTSGNKKEIVDQIVFVLSIAEEMINISQLGFHRVDSSN